MLKNETALPCVEKLRNHLLQFNLPNHNSILVNSFNISHYAHD